MQRSNASASVTARRDCSPAADDDALVAGEISQDLDERKAGVLDQRGDGLGQPYLERDSGPPPTISSRRRTGSIPSGPPNSASGGS